MKQYKKITILSVLLFSMIFSLSANAISNEKNDGITLSQLFKEYDDDCYDVVEGLLDEELSKEVDVEQIKKLNNLKEMNQKMKIDAMYLKNSLQYQSLNSTNSKEHLYKATIHAAYAFFMLNKYYLSGELLMQSYIGNRVSYDPGFGKLVVSRTRAFKNLVKDRRERRGTVEFAKRPGTYNMDAYYSLHLADYRIYGNTCSIHDIYDFENNESPNGLEQKVVQILYEAQRDGYITPYTVNVVLTF